MKTMVLILTVNLLLINCFAHNGKTLKSKPVIPAFAGITLFQDENREVELSDFSVLFDKRALVQKTDMRTVVGSIALKTKEACRKEAASTAHFLRTQAQTKKIDFALEAALFKFDPQNINWGRGEAQTITQEEVLDNQAIPGDGPFAPDIYKNIDVSVCVHKFFVLINNQKRILQFNSLAARDPMSLLEKIQQESKSISTNIEAPSTAAQSQTTESKNTSTSGIKY